MARPVLRNSPLHGRVKRIFYQDGYGFLESEEGRDIYFHENSLIRGKFEHLLPGMEVTYHEQEGEKGPQASSLKRVGKNGHHMFPKFNPKTEMEFPMAKSTTGIEHSKITEAAAPAAAIGGTFVAFLLGAVAGGIATYLLDPKDGARRRGMIFDKAKAWQNEAMTYGSDLTRKFRGQASGVETPEAEMH
jgi:cold shock CspA family protein